MKDAQADWSSPGDTAIHVTWEERQRVLQMIQSDEGIGRHLSDPAFVGTASSFRLAVDSTANMGIRAQFWKPDGSPVWMKESYKQEIGRRILELVSPVSLHPVVEWILDWPRNQHESEFEKLLPITVNHAGDF